MPCSVKHIGNTKKGKTKFPSHNPVLEGTPSIRPTAFGASEQNKKRRHTGWRLKCTWPAGERLLDDRNEPPRPQRSLVTVSYERILSKFDRRSCKHQWKFSWSVASTSDGSKNLKIKDNCRRPLGLWHGQKNVIMMIDGSMDEFWSCPPIMVGPARDQETTNSSRDFRAHTASPATCGTLSQSQVLIVQSRSSIVFTFPLDGIKSSTTMPERSRQTKHATMLLNSCISDTWCQRQRPSHQVDRHLTVAEGALAIAKRITSAFSSLSMNTYERWKRATLRRPIKTEICSFCAEGVRVRPGRGHCSWDKRGPDGKSERGLSPVSLSEKRFIAGISGQKTHAGFRARTWRVGAGRDVVELGWLAGAGWTPVIWYLKRVVCVYVCMCEQRRRSADWRDDLDQNPNLILDFCQPVTLVKSHRVPRCRNTRANISKTRLDRAPTVAQN